MSSVVIVSPPIVAEALASSWSGRLTAPLTLNVTVVVAPRSEACDPAFACSWVTSGWGRVSVAVPVASKRSDWTFDIAVPVALRLWLGVSERAAAGAVRPAQAERRPSARKAIRVRFMPATTICTAAARNVTFRHRRGDRAVRGRGLAPGIAPEGEWRSGIGGTPRHHARRKAGPTPDSRVAIRGTGRGRPCRALR